MLELLSSISSIILLSVYVVYFKQVKNGTSTPNPVSWLTWVIASSINVVTYLSVVEGDYWKSSIAIVSNLCMIGICAYSFYQKKFAKLTLFDFFILVLAILIGVFWQVTQSDRLANILIQIIFVISFIPTIYGLYMGTLSEKPAPWWIAVLAYFIQIIALCISYTGDWLVLLFPFVNGILGNGSVAVLASIKDGIFEKIRK